MCYIYILAEENVTGRL